MKNTSLKTTQKTFFNSLENGQLQRGFFTKNSRFEIYKNSYDFLYERILKIDFEKTAEAVGEKTFVKLALGYRQKHQSREWSLSLLGAEFASFIRKQRIVRKPYLADLARWEWANAMALLAPDPKPLIIADNPLKQRICFSEHAHLISSDWTVHLGKPYRYKKSFLIIARTLDGIETKPLKKIEFECLYFLMQKKNGLKISDFLGFAAKKTTPNTLQQWVRSWTAIGLLLIKP